MEFFNSPSVSRIMGITLRQLRHWVDSGLIHPVEVEETGGQKRFHFDFRNLVEIALVLALKKRSLSLQQIKRALEVFNQEFVPSDSIQHLTFFSDGQSFFSLSRDPQGIFEVLRRGQTIFAVPMDDLAREVAGRTDLAEKDIPLTLARGKKDGNYVLIKFKF